MYNHFIYGSYALALISVAFHNQVSSIITISIISKQEIIYTMVIKTRSHRHKLTHISLQSSLHMASFKPRSSCQKLFVVSLFLLSFSLVFFVLSFMPKLPFYSYEVASGVNSEPPTTTVHKWFDLVAGKIGKGRKIKIALVNVDDHVKRAYENMHGLVETVNVKFKRVSKTLEWKDLFPEWIDEDHKWAAPSCPDIPMPKLGRYSDLDVVVARVPCGGGKWSEKEGIRDVFRLQVNLVVANLAVQSGRVKPDVDQTVYVVFIGSCGAMQEIFRCDDLVTRVGNYWVYKPDMGKLKQKVLMPVGSCQIGFPYAEAGKEAWRHFMSESALHKLNHTINPQRKAYATVLHSSEAYVCGAIALAQSIKLSGSTKDLILLHDSSITAKSLRGLRASGWNTRLIRPIRSPFAKKDSYNEWNYSKLRVWQLLDYDKIIFIDADIIVTRNIDEFFYYPELSASSNDKMIFNSGIMVLQPSTCTFDHIMAKTSKLASYNGGDQGFLNEVFTWWHRLPSRVNTLKIFMRPSEGKNHEIMNDVYGIHYLGLKPWLCYKDYDCNWDKEDHQIFASDSAHKRWWEVYDAMPTKLQNYCKLTKHMDARIRKWRGIARNLNLPDHHWKIKVADPRQYKLV